ncbi:hypothetical protein BDFB_004397 [Asbolus verrucosus]|uniref:Uncharacterized protein n=1 Tax=Asbolus verrucosus TaxID=1661398 RepID=A0A482VRH5_ASBVE|nr:hypothetical protein BDFB_004397 [Asbolus verrucosus]
MVVGDIYDRSNCNKISFYCCLTSVHIESAEVDLFTADIRMNLAGRNFIVFLRAYNSHYNDTRIAGGFVLRPPMLQLYLQEKSGMKVVRLKSQLDGE